LIKLRTDGLSQSASSPVTTKAILFNDPSKRLLLYSFLTLFFVLFLVLLFFADFSLGVTFGVFLLAFGVFLLGLS